MSKSTVISTIPIRIQERKPGLVPSYYEIEPAPKGGVSTLVVEDGFHLVLIPLSDEKAPPMRVPDLSETIARSICEDFISACLGVDYTVREDKSIAIPGIFWLPGEMSPDVVKIKHHNSVNQATNNTKAWFERLILASDIEWSQTRSPKAITDQAKIACKYLGVQREWNFNALDISTSLCWACKTVVNPEAMICPSCKAIINKEAYEKAKGQFVGV